MDSALGYSVIVVNNVSVTGSLEDPGDRSAFRLRQITFGVRAGEMLAIVGESGSGKSTLLKVLGLDLKPHSGTVIVNGRDPWLLSGKQRDDLKAADICFIDQRHFGLLSGTPTTNVKGWLTALDGLSGTEATVRANQALALAGLKPDKFDASVDKVLSGGEKARVALAVALARRLPITILDEPFEGLDEKSLDRVVGSLQRLAADGGAVIVVTHHPKAPQYFERVLEFDAGQIADAKFNATRQFSANQDAPAPLPPGRAPLKIAAAGKLILVIAVLGLSFLIWQFPAERQRTLDGVKEAEVDLLTRVSELRAGDSNEPRDVETAPLQVTPAT